jgi:16S rRNA (cytidine1402-2'-O)-methyltransferase
MSQLSFPAGLYVAATPLGHLGDITQRVREALSACSLVYAEDTRRAHMLISALGIARSKSSIRMLHDHNEAAIKEKVIAEIRAGQSILLISDAGTPAISDPGYAVVDAAWKAGLHVCPLPGPSAVITALSVCGFARWPMSFWGFAPAKRAARQDWLRHIKNTGGLAVIFEAPHRATESLADCLEIFGADTQMLFGRELTKQHETLFRGTIGEIQAAIAKQQASDAGAAKGEMVWVFDFGNPPIAVADAAQVQAWAAALAPEMPASNAAKCLVKMLGVPRDQAYQAVLAASNTTDNALGRRPRKNN